MNRYHTSTQAQGIKACPRCELAEPKHNGPGSKKPERKSVGGLPTKFICFHQVELQASGDLHPNALNTRASNLVRCVQCQADMCRECFAFHLRF
jgi:hypothetical protein